jgi:predicted nuclease with TOPRIM domain
MTDAERRKIDARAKLKAELETRMRAANTDVLAAEQRVERLASELSEADDALEAARAVVEDLRDKLDALD